jgi:uncharacterized GH25 family protein
MSRNWTTFLCVSLAIIVLFDFTSARSAESKDIKQVTCTGKVVDEQGRPIAGAKVTAYEMQFDGIAGNFNLRQAGEVTTSEDGAFVFATKPKPEGSTFYECKIVAVREYLALGWTVWKMRENATYDIQLGAPEKLEGVIVDEAGKPIAGANVRANLTRTVETADGQETSEWLPGIEPLRELGAMTDSRGRFFFADLPVGVDVDLLITAAGKAITYTYQSAKKKPAFKAGQTDIKVALPDEARIEGRILDPDTGEGIAGTKFAVVACSSGLFYYRFVHTTNDDGTFKVGGLQSDKYLLRNGGFPHTYVEVESGKTTNITVQADRLSRPRGVPGVVRDPDGKPLPNAVISTYPPVTDETVTNSNGAFILRLRRARTYNEGMTYFLVRHKERNLAGSVEFDESTKEFDITMVPGTILSGKIVDTEGKSIPNTKLSLTFRMPTVGYDMREAKIDIDNTGNYEIRAIPPGHTYSIIANAEGYGRGYIEIDTRGKSNQRINVEPMVLSVANLSASGIVVNDLDQPVPGIGIYAFGNGQPSREAFTDTNGRFTIEKVCPGNLYIQANSKGGSAHRFHGQAQAEGGSTNIRIVAYEIDEHGRRVPRQPPSLVGKSLPDLKELGIEISPDEIEGKRILVCFWDFERRPSRQCMTQLAKQNEQLKSQGVIVLAVQASKTEQEALNQWIKKYNIPFSVGMVQGDAKKINFNWGVRSLPWLILTDTNHIVKIEGFALQEVNEKLKQIDGG